MSLVIDLAAVRRLEELAFRGWPTLEAQDRAGWRLRFAGGYTKRANSINALGRNAQTDLSTLEKLEAAYRERGQAPVWRLSPLAPPTMDNILAARGYRTIERSLLQVCPLHAGFTAAPEVRIHAEPMPAWLEAFCLHSPVRPEHRDVMRRQPGRTQAHVNFCGRQIRRLHGFQRLDIFTKLRVSVGGKTGGSQFLAHVAG